MTPRRAIRRRTITGCGKNSHASKSWRKKARHKPEGEGIMSMLIEEARTLSPGMKVIHDGDGIERIVEKLSGHKVIVSPRLRGRGTKAQQTLHSFARFHSLKNGNGAKYTYPGTFADPNYKPAAKLPDPVRLMGRRPPDEDLYFIACKLVELKKAGAITLHNIRAEAYFACLEAEL
jgi:hypothetical protein